MIQTSRYPVVAIFLVFALGYFLSSFVRGVIATLAPVLVTEFSLSSGQLGLLGGAYFLGFAVLQLPLGNWLDRFGPRDVLLTCLVGAVLSCVAFALAEGFMSLLLARLLGGIGVSACLIAPLTAARLWLSKDFQQSVNSWMLMAGSLGLLGATLPVQWVLPLFGWRPIFYVIAALFVLVAVGTAWKVPNERKPAALGSSQTLIESYKPIFGNRYFKHIAFLGFINYGILVAVQTLWAGPWMTNVSGYSVDQAAKGLFAINLTMLVVFWVWGLVNPRLYKAGVTPERMMVWGLPLSVLSLAVIAWLGRSAGWEAFAVFCICSSVLAATHPAVGMAFSTNEAGRAIAAFNLLLFLGVFFTQWCVGAGIDLLKATGWAAEQAYRLIFSILSILSFLSYLWFVWGQRKRHLTLEAAA